jgi:integrase
LAALLTSTRIAPSFCCTSRIAAWSASTSVTLHCKNSGALPASPASRELALTAVQSLFEFWVQRGYVPLNPWRAGPKRDPAPRVQFREKALTVSEWDRVRDHVRELPEGEPQARRKAVLTLLYGSGLRRAELAAVSVGQVRRSTDDEEQEFWELEVVGKGKRARLVPVIDPAVAALKAYFAYRFGEVDLLEVPPAEPLIASLPGRQQRRRQRKALSAWAINAIVSEAMRESAIDGAPAPRLRKASCHSLRHTFATHALQLDPQALPHIQKILGHASIVTTANNYLTTDQTERRKVANRLAERAEF